MAIHLSKRVIIIIVVSVIFVGGLTVGALLILRSAPTDTTKPGDGNGAIKLNSSYYQNAVDVAVTQGPEAGQAVLNQVLSQTSDAKEQAAVYGSKAALATSSQGGSNTTDALTFALKADELAPTDLTASFVASTYRNTGNKAKAIEYYQKALDRVNLTNATDEVKGNYAYYQESLKALKGE